MMKSLKYIILIVLTAFIFNACYYDQEEVLYRFNPGVCDTTNVTYSQTIAPVMQASCNSCHSTTGASGGWITDNYTKLNVIAVNGKFYGTITHASGFSPMPKGSGQLNTCQISQIKKWLDSGSPNN
ncbi:MAG: hypothetical protein HGB12_15910 [Bacteroidetes bacterium]|nr:hypothetical protein [Bacteroidota bacterium]